MAWLSGWTWRIKLSIDADDVTAALTNFPVLIYISTSSGYNSEDVSFIFDKIGSNSLKIAVTGSDGETECKVEIEKWDYGSEEAWIWVKVPTISNTVDTDLYLYYDNAHADNTANVGVVGSTPGKAVWDDNFVGVWHLSESAGGSEAVKDSTQYENHGTDYGSPTFGVDGQVNSAVDFTQSGDDDEVRIDHSDSLNINGDEITIEAWIKPTLIGAWDKIYNKPLSNSTWNSPYILYELRSSNDSGGYPGIALNIGNANQDANSDTLISTGVWSYLVGRYSGSLIDILIDTVQRGTNSISGNLITGTTHAKMALRGDGSTIESYDGVIDEIRISDIARVDAWILATHESFRDHIFDWGTEEGGVTYKLEGITKDKNEDVLGSCECYLFKDNQDDTLTYEDYVLSNAVTGVYSFTGLTDDDAQYIVVAWKDDSPHVFDVTDHVLQPEEE